ncbi:MAG: hypothetical protein NTY47_02715, partial [Candidatus Omnitrophica bacterium]|nr:hypothetical protein [Candidatus Omnitrophota bacterium]
ARKFDLEYQAVDEPDKKLEPMDISELLARRNFPWWRKYQLKNKLQLAQCPKPPKKSSQKFAPNNFSYTPLDFARCTKIIWLLALMWRDPVSRSAGIPEEWYFTCFNQKIHRWNTDISKPVNYRTQVTADQLLRQYLSDKEAQFMLLLCDSLGEKLDAQAQASAVYITQKLFAQPQARQELLAFNDFIPHAVSLLSRDNRPYAEQVGIDIGCDSCYGYCKFDLEARDAIKISEFNTQEHHLLLTLKCLMALFCRGHISMQESLFANFGDNHALAKTRVEEPKEVKAELVHLSLVPLDVNIIGKTAYSVGRLSGDLTVVGRNNGRVRVKTKQGIAWVQADELFILIDLAALKVKKPAAVDPAVMLAGFVLFPGLTGWWGVILMVFIGLLIMVENHAEARSCGNPLDMAAQGRLSEIKPDADVLNCRVLVNDAYAALRRHFSKDGYAYIGRTLLMAMLRDPERVLGVELAKEIFPDKEVNKHFTLAELDRLARAIRAELAYRESGALTVEEAAEEFGI